MLLLLKVIPQVLHILVVLKFRVALNVNNAHLNVVTQQFVEYHCKSTFGLILGLHGSEQKVEPLGLLYEQRLQDVPPTEREQLTLCLAQCLGKREYAYTKRHKIVILVNNKAQQPLVGQWNVHLHKLFNLLWCERCKAIKLCIALVAQFKECLAITPCNLGTGFCPHNAHAELLLNNGGNTLCLGPLFSRYLEQELHPINILHITQTLKVLGIIGVIIYCSHCTQAVKTLNEHTLGIEIGKAQRTLYLSHTTLTCPRLGCGEERIYHLVVINEIYPTETRCLYAPFLVGMRIYYSSNTTHDFTVAVGKEIVGIAELERRITVFAQSTHCILEQLGNKIRVTLVQFIIKTHKAL